jgi:hypothetical protein
VPMSSELLDPHTETKMMLSRKRRQLLNTEICGELPSPKTLPLSQILKNQAYRLGNRPPSHMCPIHIV